MEVPGVCSCYGLAGGYFLLPAAIFHGITVKPAFGLDPEITLFYS